MLTGSNRYSKQKAKLQYAKMIKIYHNWSTLINIVHFVSLFGCFWYHPTVIPVTKLQAGSTAPGPHLAAQASSDHGGRLQCAPVAYSSDRSTRQPAGCYFTGVVPEFNIMLYCGHWFFWVTKAACLGFRHSKLVITWFYRPKWSKMAIGCKFQSRPCHRGLFLFRGLPWYPRVVPCQSPTAIPGGAGLQLSGRPWVLFTDLLKPLKS